MTLPAHLDGERGSIAGPLSGGYGCVILHVDAQAQNDTQIRRFVCPMDLRIQEVSVVQDDITVTNAVTYAVSNGAAGGTDVIAARNMPADDTVETITPLAATSTDATTALANRDFDKGDVLTWTTVTTASDTIDGADLTVTYWAKGHVVAAKAND